jgi:DNA-directed RNA polymerase beta' subunit
VDYAEVLCIRRTHTRPNGNNIIKKKTKMILTWQHARHNTHTIPHIQDVDFTKVHTRTHSSQEWHKQRNTREQHSGHMHHYHKALKHTPIITTSGKTKQNTNTNIHIQGVEMVSDLPVNISPLTALNLLQDIFKADRNLLSLIYGTAQPDPENKGAPPKLYLDPYMFFLQTLPVPPNRFRPPVHLGESQYEHPYNASIKQVMQDNQAILALIQKPEDGSAALPLDTDAVMKNWLSMQVHVNVMIDSTKGDKKTSDDAAKGKKQELERKEGLMRMNMMGKRVNFACRYFCFLVLS